MEKLLDSFVGWPPLGQAVFVLIVFSSLIGALTVPFRYLAICVRGWPPPQPIQEDADEDTDMDDE